MNNQPMNQDQQMTFSDTSSSCTYQGPRWLVEERDACGVGFIAHRLNKASHEIVTKALAALTCLEHRGGCSADQDSGDGAGILTAIPWELFQAEFATKGVELTSTKNIA
ncbi:MAG: hypothetical protein ICV85_04340, partial [Tolypothrix sp. T3-bin4]|nr:hypothetical protein [Tolypothrix sp. T3-bin4]